MASSRYKRSKTDRMIAGVCGGLGLYLGVDATFVRVGFVLLALASGVGFPLYFLLVIIAPSEADVSDIDIRFPGEESPYEPTAVRPLKIEIDEPRGDKNRTVAFGLIGVGALLLFNQIGWFSLSVVLPVLFIGLGVYFVAKRK